MDQSSPFLKRSRPMRIPRYPWEAEEGVLHSKKGDEWQYFPRSIFAKRESGLFSNRQPNLARKASLKASISLNPKPPSNLGTVSLSHATQFILFFSGFSSHQKRTTTDWICLQSELGSLKQTLHMIGSSLFLISLPLESSSSSSTLFLSL